MRALELSSRKKKWSTKSHNGCLDCRRRRVKCGEERPACARCIRGGQRCSYILTFAAPYRPDPERVDGMTQTISQSYGDALDQQCLRFWLQRTGPAVSMTSRCGDFWTVIIPQASWHYPEVKNLLVAVSVLDQFVVGAKHIGCSEHQIETSLRYYNKALNGMAAKKAILPDLIYPSVMCAVYECISSNARKKEIHVKACRRMVETMQQSKSGQLSPENDLLVGAVAAEASCYNSDFVGGQDTDESVDPLFLTVEAARSELHLIYDIFEQETFVPPDTIRLLSKRVGRWRHASARHRYTGVTPLHANRTSFLLCSCILTLIQINTFKGGSPERTKLYRGIIEDVAKMMEYEDFAELSRALSIVLDHITARSPPRSNEHVRAARLRSSLLWRGQKLAMQASSHSTEMPHVEPAQGRPVTTRAR